MENFGGHPSLCGDVPSLLKFCSSGLLRDCLYFRIFANLNDASGVA